MAAGVLLLMAAGAASAQQRARRPEVVLYPGPAPKVYKMEIYNGPTRTVGYAARNVTMSDRVILRELGDAESDPSPVIVAGLTGGFTAYAGGFLPPVLPATITPIYAAVPTDITPIAFGGGFVPNFPSAATSSIVPTSTDDSGLLRQQRKFLALARAAGSPRLRAALGMDEEAAAVSPLPKVVKPAAGEEDSASAASVVLTLSGGRKVLCSSIEESGLWVLATRTDGKTLRLRASEILRIEERVRR